MKRIVSHLAVIYHRHHVTMSLCHYVFGLLLLSSVICYLSSVICLAEPLTLDKCIQLALKNNPTIRIAQQQIFSADAKRQEAFTSYLPKLNTANTYTRMGKIPVMRLGMELPPDIPPQYKPLIEAFLKSFPEEFEVGFYHNYNIGLTFQQPLFTWGKIRNANLLANLDLQATRENYGKTREELILNVKRTFYGVLLGEEFVKIAEEAIEITKAHVDVAKAFYAEGKVSHYDVLRAEVQLTNLQTNLTQAKNGLTLTKDGLKLLLDFEANKEIELAGEFGYEDREMNLEECQKKALVANSQLKELKIRQQMAETAVKLAKAANKPNIALVGNYSYQNPYMMQQKWGSQWTGTIALQLPIFDGFASWKKVDQAKAAIEQVNLGRILAEKGLLLQIKQIWLKFNAAKEIIAAQKKNIEQTEEGLNIARERYAVGLASNIEILDAQMAVTEAKLSYIKSLYDYIIAQAELAAAIKGGVGGVPTSVGAAGTGISPGMEMSLPAGAEMMLQQLGEMGFPR